MESMLACCIYKHASSLPPMDGQAVLSGGTGLCAFLILCGAEMVVGSAPWCGAGQFISFEDT